MCFVGSIFLLLNTANVISALTKCYPLNGQEYCFYTDSALLSWEKAREFCTKRNSTLPIITDEDIDNVFQRFLLDNNNDTVSGSYTEQMSNYVWLDAHALHVDNFDEWHWINGQPSGLSSYTFVYYHPQYSVVIRSTASVCSSVGLSVIFRGKSRISVYGGVKWSLGFSPFRSLLFFFSFPLSSHLCLLVCSLPPCFALHSFFPFPLPSSPPISGA